MTLQTARKRLDQLLRIVATGEEIQIVEKRKLVARLVPPKEQEVDWSGTFAKLGEIWGRKPLPGVPGSQLLRQGRQD